MKMKVLVLLSCVVLAASGLRVSTLTAHKQQKLKKTRMTVLKMPQPQEKVDLDLCPTCVSFTEETIDIMMDILLNIGILDSCGVLCSIVEQKTGSQAIGAVCNILCDVVGIDDFVKFITKADLDPIYFCELTKMCPIFDQGDATLTELNILPLKGPPGDRTISFTYNSTNGTGTGQININITTVDKFPVSSSLLIQKQPPGFYPTALKLSAEKSPDCHPQQQKCETWKHGNYTLTVSVCNGECFSEHPHSKVYDRKSMNFTITKETMGSQH
ncbi:countin-3-like [Haliotis cracherodii]|uniref:countin-3-like n=1 Tax=Haliotis cracherodii TaxID=6455 RepID=UPI0039ECE500